MERWYVAETQPHAEAKALWHLERQGFTAYLPQYRKVRRHARRTDEVRAPLFPRYLFVRIDVARAAWRAIRSTIGVARLVSQGERPAPVPDGVVEDIRGREDERGLVTIEPGFRRGQTLRVLTGALADQVGLFESITDERRVVLLLELLGRRIEVCVSMDAVVPAG
jgi:transcriptional antiterminator RfaH